ncbi:hypothetical protein ACX801_07920 [Arthrobacter bambusae]
MGLAPIAGEALREANAFAERLADAGSGVDRSVEIDEWARERAETAYPVPPDHRRPPGAVAAWARWVLSTMLVHLVFGALLVVIVVGALEQMSGDLVAGLVGFIGTAGAWWGTAKFVREVRERRSKRQATRLDPDGGKRTVLAYALGDAVRTDYRAALRRRGAPDS